MHNRDTFSIKETREQLSHLVEQVAIAKKRFLITKFGKPKALLVPVPAAKFRESKSSGLEASFGAWKQRKDIRDSAQWVAKLRKQISLRYG